MSHQKGRLKNSKFWLCLSLILCLVSAIVASAVQTSGGIRIKEMSWESPSGHQLAAYLYIPQNATKDTPAPGVVTIEGWYNNKEMQDLYSIELARRGYVGLGTLICAFCLGPFIQFFDRTFSQKVLQYKPNN